MSAARALLVVLGMLLWARPLWAEGSAWQRTFPPRAAETWLDGERLSVMVVGADGEASAEEAAAALREALRGSKRVQLMMDGSSLGRTAGLDDQTIVARAGALPIDVVGVVRIFVGAEGSVATVAFYDGRGRSTSSLRAVLGRPIAVREVALPLGEGGAGGSSRDESILRRRRACTPHASSRSHSRPRSPSTPAASGRRRSRSAIRSSRRGNRAGPLPDRRMSRRTSSPTLHPRRPRLRR